MTCTQLTTTADRVPVTLASRVAGYAGQAWRTYWNWRARQATVQILRSLDARTLRDIGLSPSEIELVVYGRPGERRRRYYEGWRLRGGV